MTEPWFDANLYGWLPAVVMAASGIGTTAAAGKLTPRGVARWPIVGSFYVQVAASVLLLVAALAGWMMDQPRSVWFALLLPGVISLVILAATIPRVLRRYRQAAARRALA